MNKPCCCELYFTLTWQFVIEQFTLFIGSNKQNEKSKTFSLKEEMVAVFLMHTNTFQQKPVWVSVLRVNQIKQGVDIKTLPVTSNQPTKTHLELSMIGGYHSFVPPCFLLGKQGFYLAVKLGPLLLLW